MKRWYVVQVYTGFEEVVKADLLRQVIDQNLPEFVDEILIPTGQVAGMFSGEESKEEKIFPGYLLIHMEMNGETYRLVSSNARVTRFLGGDTPVALSEKEVNRIFSQIDGELSLPDNKEVFVVGSEIQIESGPFAGFVGMVDKIDEERERLVVMVSIFGRLTPVELGFNQVKR